MQVAADTDGDARAAAAIVAGGRRRHRSRNESLAGRLIRTEGDSPCNAGTIKNCKVRRLGDGYRTALIYYVSRRSSQYKRERLYLPVRPCEDAPCSGRQPIGETHPNGG
ncbi:hypothetical protein GWI33_011420 [Rhynchophorus ferrugineus]|uniref:Uncharacterized protein n=1 Tax=Rhynchophorus ferrugineus TaxID=354439 RepID=A0A834ISL6_RHYFE|nr:hypothetical protein GWI33_011420 [Rhynchophorus ferrugineus]